jgi:hypothetical protein
MNRQCVSRIRRPFRKSSTHDPCASRLNTYLAIAVSALVCGSRPNDSARTAGACSGRRGAVLLLMRHEKKGT